MTERKSWDFDGYDWLDEYTEHMRALPRLAYAETLRRLPVAAGARAGEHVLDLGTGTGNSALPFLELGCTVVGLDPSEEMLRRGEPVRERFPETYAVRHVDDCFLALPLPDERFDVVVAVYAIHHLDEQAQEQAVRGMKASLAPGGRIAIADTMFRDLGHKRELLASDETLEDEYHPLLDVLPKAMERAGLRVQREQVAPLVWILVGR